MTLHKNNKMILERPIYFKITTAYKLAFKEAYNGVGLESVYRDRNSNYVKKLKERESIIFTTRVF